MLEDPDDLAILDAIIGLADSFQLQTIAEGVETDAHIHLLLRLGCDLAQGYAIARPMPAADIPSWVAGRRKPVTPPPAKIAREELPILFAMTEHRAWIKALTLHLRDRQMAPPPLDHHQCRFGQWLDRTCSNIEANHPLRQKVLSLHEDIHQRANDLLDIKQRDHDEDDWRKLGLSEIEALRDELLAALESVLDHATAQGASPASRGH
jgi:hypothetical protein